MKKNKIDAIIVGHQSSLFVNQLATYWKNSGKSVVIATHDKQNKGCRSNGLKIINSIEEESLLLRMLLFFVWFFSRFSEKIILFFSKERTRKAMGEDRVYKPSFTNSITNSISIFFAIRNIKPGFIFIQEVFDYGLLSLFIKKIPTIVMPWGGDVYMYANTSFFSKLMVKSSLKNADLICPTADYAKGYISANYRIPEKKIVPISWGVDIDKIKGFSKQKYRIRGKYGIDKGKKVVMNIRRFIPLWGSDEVLNVFCDLAEDPQVHFVLLGGENVKKFVDDAKKEINEKELGSRFTIFDYNIELDEVLELMAISDVFVSLMHKGDMRSFSVLQATLACGVPVISDAHEYREMEKKGFKAIFVSPTDHEKVVSEIKNLLNNKDRRERIRQDNEEYMMNNEDYQKQMERLLSEINKVKGER